MKYQLVGWERMQILLLKPGHIHLMYRILNNLTINDQREEIRAENDKWKYQ